MSRIVLTFDTDQFSACAEDIEQLAKDIQAFINILCNASPDYVEAGNLLQRQLDEQMKKLTEDKPDPRSPKEKMQEKFCDIFDEANLGFTAWDLNERHGDDPVPGLFDAWDNFLNQIGEAMGPMCYAAWTLSCKFKQAGYKSDWIDACITYYEENWEF
jgi:hypothetical protein